MRTKMRNINKIFRTTCFLFIFFCLSLIDGYFSSINLKNSFFPPSASTDGKEVWTKTYEPYTGASSIWVDEKYIYTCGYQFNSYGGGYNLLILKWDQNGRIIWDYVLSSPDDTMGLKIWGDKEFLYIYGSVREWETPEYVNSLLVKIDKNGNEIWQRQWGLSTFMRHWVMGDESFAYTFSESVNNTINITESSFIKWDLDGNVVWNNTWEDYDFNSYHCGLVIDQSSIFICGTTKNWDTVSYEIMLLKWDKNGNLIWNRTVFPNCVVEISEIAMDDSYIYLCGDKYIEGSNSFYIGKLDKECNLLWNQTMSIVNYSFSYAICCNEREILVSSYIDIWLYDFYTYLSRWSKNGELRSITEWNSSSTAYVYFLGLSCDEKNVYLCGSPMYLYGSLILIKWDISKNYFLRIGVPFISVGVFIISFWMVLKPVTRLKKYRRYNYLKESLEKIQSKLIHQRDYNNNYYALEMLIPEIEKLNDPEMTKIWEKLYQECTLNLNFQNELERLKKLVENGQNDNIYIDLINLLKRSHLPEYDGMVDREIVSEITDFLKQVSKDPEN